MATPKSRVLVVEDDRSLRTTLMATLRADGYAPAEAVGVHDALQQIEQSPPDLVILDLGLPDGDGMDVIKNRRAAADMTPIIILSARDDETSKVKALDLGADDYVTKPFGVAELLARTRSALRHGIQERGAPPIVRTGDLEIDLARRAVTKHGAELRLSRKEFDLLAELAVEQGKPVSHEQLLKAVWGSPDADIRYLRIYIGQVREKVEDDPQRPQIVLAEPGYGYRMR